MKIWNASKDHWTFSFSAVFFRFENWLSYFALLVLWEEGKLVGRINGALLVQRVRSACFSLLEITILTNVAVKCFNFLPFFSISNSIRWEHTYIHTYMHCKSDRKIKTILTIQMEHLKMQLTFFY